MFFLLFLNLAWAKPEPQLWRAGPITISLVEAPGGGLINPACLPPSKCLSTKASSTKLDLKGELSTIPNTVCVEKYKGQILYASRGRKTQPLCLFSDGSYASIDALVKEKFPAPQ